MTARSEVIAPVRVAKPGQGRALLGGDWLLIDANNLIARCIMATLKEDLRAGETFTGGVYSTLSSLAALLAREETSRVRRVYAVFDHSVPEFRKKLLPDYKSKRKERRALADEDQMKRAFAQLGICWEMFPLLGIPCVCVDGYEADDVIAASARYAMGQKVGAIIGSADRDFWQMIRHGAKVWDFNLQVLLTRTNFHQRTGLTPELFLLYKLLLGDPSDSIHGAAGYGAVRAAEVVLEYGQGNKTAHALRVDQQLDRLVAMVAKRTAPQAHERKLVESAGTLSLVSEAIDLTRSPLYDAEDGLRLVLGAREPFNEMKALQFFRRLSFQSVLGNPERYLMPFRRLAKRWQ